MLADLTDASLLTGIAFGGIATMGIVGTWAWRGWGAFWHRLNDVVDQKLEPVLANQDEVKVDIATLIQWRAKMDYQLSPNSGHSMVDKLDRIEAAIGQLTTTAGG